MDVTYRVYNGQGMVVLETTRLWGALVRSDNLRKHGAGGEITADGQEGLDYERLAYWTSGKSCRQPTQAELEAAGYKPKALCDHCGKESGELEDGAMDTVEGQRVGKECQALHAREAEYQ